MSEQPRDQDANSAPKGDGCVLAILMTVGIGLLLPGLCGLVALLSIVDKLFSDPGIAFLVLSSVAAGVGGIVLLARARRMAGYPGPRDDS